MLLLLMTLCLSKILIFTSKRASSLASLENVDLARALFSAPSSEISYTSIQQSSKYGSSVSGLNRRFKSKDAAGRAELRQVASELVGGVAKLFKPPIRLNGSLAYAQ